MDNLTQKYSALDIADRIIRFAKDNKESVTELTPLKIQKLLFYAQGWYAANKNTRLFEDDIYAWPYGPVVIKVYKHFKDDGSNDLTEKEIDFSELSEDKNVEKFLEQLMDTYGKMSAYELVARTHREPVWEKNSETTNKLMPFEDIKRAFKLKLVES
jgi:uncharacterized phage-associated protein